MWQQRFSRTRGHHQWPNDGSDTGHEDHYNRPGTFAQPIRTLIPGQHPQGGLVHDMNKAPFAPQQGLQGTNPGQQVVHPGGPNIVYHPPPQQVQSRQQQNNVPAGTPPTQHAPAAYYHSARAQAPPRQMPTMQPQGQASSMPMNMMSNPNTGNQQGFYTNRQQPTVYIQQQPVQQIAPHHYVYPAHQTMAAAGPVEFNPSSDALSVPLLQPHPSSRFPIENGDFGSTGMHYARYQPGAYQSQNPQILYTPQQTPFSNINYYSQMVNLHQPNRPNAIPQQINMQAQQQPLPVREKKIISITDPVTKKDITEDILSNNKDRTTGTPYGADAAGARGTPPPAAGVMVSEQNDIPALFARQVAMVIALDPKNEEDAAARHQRDPHAAKTVEEEAASMQPASSPESALGALNGDIVVQCNAGEAIVVVPEDDVEMEDAIDDPLPHVEATIDIRDSVINADAAVFEPQVPAEAAPLPQSTVVVEVKEVENDVVVPHTVLPPSVPLTAQPLRISSDIVMHKPPQSLPPFPPQKAAEVVVAPQVQPLPQRTVLNDGGSGLQFGSIDAIPVPEKPAHGMTPPGSTAVIQILPEQPHVATIPPPAQFPSLPKPATVYSSPPKPAAQAVQQPQPPAAAAAVPQGLPPQSTSRQVQQPAQAQPPPAQQPRQNGELAEVPNSTVDGIDSDAKDPKKQKGKRKPKDTNRKGDTKEGGEMDAFLDKDESTLPPVTAAVVSVPPPDRPVEREVQVETENNVPEEVIDKEEKRKVAEKNEENAKVSNQVQEQEEEPEQDENVPVIDQPEAPGVITLKFNYLPNQWSPLNPEGKMQYDRAFLLELQQQPMSQKRPEGLPNLEVIRDSNGGKPRGNYEARGGMGNKPMGNASMGATGGGHDFTPNYFSSGGPPSRTQVRGRPSQQGGRKEQQQQPQRKILSLSIGQEIQLHSSTDAWKPAYKLSNSQDPEQEKTEKLFRKVRSMLNKLTPQNFETLMEQILNFEIDTEERLAGVIDLFFEKAIDEPSFSGAYAEMCKRLLNLKVSSSKGGETSNFKKLIITKCQKEFEKDGDDFRRRDKRVKEIATSETEEQKLELTLEMEEAEKKSRHRSLGNIRFIGELFKLSVLTANIMHDCLNKLLIANNEDSLENLCRLLTTIGKDLEHAPLPGKQKHQDNKMGDYFKKMKELVNRKDLSSRVRFMLQDVIDLRMSLWVPRRVDNTPQTIAQIHEEAEREQSEKQAIFQQPMPMLKRPDDRDRRGGGGGGGGGGGAMGGGPGKRGGNDNDGGGWNTVSSNKRTTPTVDPGKTKINRPQAVDEDQIQFGPSRASSWSRGSSGGIKSNSQEGDRAAAGPANRFSALATEVPCNADRRGNNRPGSVNMNNRDRDNRGRNVQLPPMSQRLSSRPPPSREREQALACVKNLSANEVSGGACGGSTPSTNRYQLSGSRDSSVTREGERKEPAVSESRPRPGPALDRDSIEKKTKSIIDEYLHINDFQDASLYVKDLGMADANALPIFVAAVFNQVLERSLVARQHTGQLFTGLVNQKVMTAEQFNLGLREMLECAEDMEIDVPMFWQYLAEILSPMFEALALPLSTLKLYTTALPNKSLHEKLLINVINVISKNMVKAKLRELWQASKLQIASFLPPDADVQAFMEAKQLTFLEGEPEAVGGACAAAEECLPMDNIQAGLKALLQTRQRNEQLFDWINVHVPEAQQTQPTFIRALVTAIASSAIKSKDDGHVEFDQPPFDMLCTVIKRYVDNKDQLELETLYSLQLFVHSYQHPQNLLTQFFQALYNAEVISEEAFSQWRSVEVPREREGHAIAVKSVNHFLDFVANNKEQEDDEEGA